MILIDKTIHDIANLTIVPASTMLDTLLDLRNIVETASKEIEAEEVLV